jgi:cephalosporin-C deacetylase-like acetyl esterase
MLPAAVLARAALLEATTGTPADAADPAVAIAALRSRVAWCLGLDRIPRAHVSFTCLRELAGDGYTVEVGTFEAVPGLPVPAHIYRPDGPGPHPAVVHAPGHWMENARLEPALQTFNVGLARGGMVVLCYDPIGQGERRVGWHTHGQLAPLLAGFTSLGVMVTETRGALDVLAARGDVDSDRLAVTGASGGGFVSTFTAVVDERIAAACICCILNAHLSQLRDAAYGTGWDGWADLCNQVPRLAATANMGVVLGAAAPRSVTVVHAVDDPPFPIEGARRVVADAAAVYRAVGASSPRLIEIEGGHGLHPAMRDRARRALCEAVGLPEPPAETAFPMLASAWPVTHDVARAGSPQSMARPAGRLPGEALAADHDTNPVVTGLAREVAVSLRRVRRTAGDRLIALRAPAPQVRVQNHVPLADGGYAQRLEIVVEPQIVLDAVLVLPESWADVAPGVLVTVDEGGKVAALSGPSAALAAERGWAVLAADLRGTGESAASEFELATATWLLDRDLLADRVHDLRSCVRVLSERYSTGQQIDKRRIVVHGAGAFGLIALLACAVDADIAGAASTGFVASLEDLLVESPRITPMVYPFRALEAYDIDDLVALAAPRPAVAAAGEEGVARVLEEVAA